MQNKLSSKNLLLILFFAQLIITLIAFNKIILHPNDTMFLNGWDGARNYFSFKSYLGQPVEAGWRNFALMGYPYGTNVFYVDNTPALAIPLRWFCMYIYDVSAYGVAITNWTSIFFQFIAAFILFKILSRLLDTKLFVFFISLSFAWIHPQLFRLSNGHFNLASTWTILLSIYCLLALYQGYYQNNKKLSKKHLVVLIATHWFASMMHLYYLVIIGVLISFFALIWSIKHYLNNKSEWKESLSNLAVFAAATLGVLVTVFCTIYCIDDYYHLRQTTAVGYDTIHWKLRFQSLFTHEKFQTIGFPITWTKKLNYESRAYLGNFTLYAVLGLVYLRFIKKQYFIPFKEILSSRKGQFIQILFMVGMVSFSIALGEVYTIDKNHYRIYNYTNPFYWVHQVTDMVTQFRCVSRFFWIGFWAWNIAMVFTVEHYWRHTTAKFIRYGIGILLLFAVVDMSDFVRFSNSVHTPSFLSNKKNDPHMALQEKNIDLTAYQATLPIPYFNESCEVKGYVFNTHTSFQKGIYAVANRHNLPTIAVSSGRYPLKHVKEAFSIFTKEKPDKEFLDKLNDKPILVIYNKQAAWNLKKFLGKKVPTIEPIKTVLENGKNLPSKYQMDTLFETKTHIYLSWDVQKLKY